MTVHELKTSDFPRLRCGHQLSAVKQKKLLSLLFTDIRLQHSNFVLSDEGRQQLELISLRCEHTQELHKHQDLHDSVISEPTSLQEVDGDFR